MSFTLVELRSKLPSGVRINFVEYIGVADGSVALKTMLTIGKLAVDQGSAKEYIKYMYCFLIDVSLSQVGLLVLSFIILSCLILS